MAREHRFIVPLPNCLHARPASHLESVANRFASDVALVNERTGRNANAKSVLSLVGTDVRHNDPCRIRVSGADEDGAGAALEAFLRDVLPGCDDALPPPPVEHADFLVPRSLRAAGLDEYFRGTPVSAGVGTGTVVVAGAPALPADHRGNGNGAVDAAQERRRFDDAIAALRAATEARIAASTHAQEAAVLGAHLSIIRDVAFADMVNQLIAADGRTAAHAVVEASAYFVATLQNARSAYLRERVLDVQDVGAQLLDVILGRRGQGPAAPRLREPSVVVADRLTPGQFLALDRALLRALVLRQGGTTSHTVILARSMNIPALVGVSEALTHLRGGQEVIVDAVLGLVVPRVTGPLRRYYELEARRLARMQQSLNSARQLRAATSDGHHVQVMANVASAGEVRPAVENGAEGVGLFRTEMLFMDRDAPPGEDEQFEVYARAIETAAGRPVTIRLIDVGGDKPVPYLNLPAEANPFLGYRGVRIYEEHAGLLRTQLRSILRAANAGEARILVPMIASVEEARAVRETLAQVRNELAAEGVKLERMPALGAMVEVPSAAFVIGELAREVDFFSVGSNDLSQYFLAADRDNRHVSSIYGWSHPAFLRLLKKVVDDAHAAGRTVSLCGEMADSSAAVPLLVGLGFDEVSLASPRVVNVKRAVASSRFRSCADLLERALQCATRAEVEALVNTFTADGGNHQPLLSPELMLRSDATTMAEVIKELTDGIWLAGRVARPQVIEEKVWQREEVYSTGFGYGFAIPHCKSEHLLASSIAVAKLERPVEWGATGETKPVDVVMLLALRESDHGNEHMRIFAKLSRLVMREEFRDRVRAERDPEKLLAFLEESLGLRAAVA